MAPDDSDVDSAVGEEEPVSERELPAEGTETARSPEQSLPEQLSQTVPSRRAYGVERLDGKGTGVGLLSPRERQYLHHSQRLDSTGRDAVQDVLSQRVGEFVETEWPLITEAYPDIATALREELCGGGET
jgi:hypothetical protein